MFIANRRDGASPDDFTLKSLLARQELEADKYLLKIIQTACKGENLHAAFDATLLLSQPGSLAAAGKIAAFFHLPALEDRIARAAEEKCGIRDELESNKRELKWSHRVDDRTIPAPADLSRPGSSGWFSSAATTSTPRAQTAYSTASTSRRIPPSAPSSKEKKKRALEEVDSAFDRSDDFEHHDDNESVMHVDEEYESQDDQQPGTSPKMYRSEAEDEMVDEPETIMAPPPASRTKRPSLPLFVTQ